MFNLNFEESAKENIYFLSEPPTPQPQFNELKIKDTQPVREPVVNTDESVAGIEMETGWC